MPASTITVAQWVRRTIQWWRRTNGRAFCSLVTIGSVTLPRYGRTGRRVRGDEGILTNVQRLPRPPRPALACRPDDSTPTRRSRPPRTDRRARRRCLQLVMELESQRAGVVPLTRPGAVASHAAQSHRAVATGRSGAARRVRTGPRVPPAVRRRSRRGRAGRDVRRHLVRHRVSRARQAANRVLLRRARAARLGSNLFRRPRGPRRGPVQGAFGPARPARRRRPVLYQGILRPTTAARWMAGGCRGAVRRGRDAARAGARAEGRSLPRDGASLRAPRERGRVARHGGPCADPAPGHGPRAERPGGPRAVPSALRRRT